MATFLFKLGRGAFRRRGLVALLWVVLLALAGVGAATASTAPPSTFSIPGTESQKAFDLLEERFPGAGSDGATARVVFQAPEGTSMTDPEVKAAVGETLRELRPGSGQVASVADPYAVKSVSPDGSIGYATVTYEVPSTELADATREELKDVGDPAREAGLRVEIGGDALQAVPHTGAGEVIGVGVAAVVLVVTLGSLVAAGLPLVTALVGVGISISTITVLAGSLGLDSTTSILAMMIGLAVGIDYALFLVTRYRGEVAEGREREEAAGRATGTAGSAVVFAGLTVVIALAGLAVVDIPMLTKMGLAAAGAVVVAVLIAITLIPALLGLAGRHALGRLHGRHGAPEPGREPKPNAGTRWARFVLRRPVSVLLVGVLGLGAIAVPVTSLELGLPDDGAQPVDTTQRQAYDLISEGFGPGFNGPLTLVVDGDRRAAQEAVAQVKDLEGVAAVTPPRFNEAGDTAVITIVPEKRPSSVATENLVRDIRDTAGEDVLVSGTTALNIDFSQKMTDALVPYLALVVGLAFLLLMVVFRSVLVPLKAALGFLLSVAAALGAVVAVFQWGWLSEVFGVEQTGPVMSMMPIFMVGVVFGLAMDYEVFLVTRMREAYVHGERPGQAVVTGFRHGARVVTAAAVIMIAVFSGFIGSGEQMIKMMGLGLAIAVFFDAFVVRMAIVPAVLALLGRSAWWLPRWLDRLLPDVDVEGSRLTAAAPTAPAAAVAEAAAPAEAAARDEVPAAGAVHVTGRVSRPGGGAVTGAAVTLTDAAGRQAGRCRTDDDGGYRIAVPAAGPYVVIASAPGCRPQAAHVLVGDATARTDLRLDGAARLLGTVRTADGAPLPGTRVVLTDAEGHVVHSTLTGDDGGYDLHDLHAGVYTVVAGGSGRRPDARTVSVSDTGDHRHDCVLQDAAGLNGTVRHAASGQGVACARVSLRDAAGGTVAVTETDAEGRYRLPGVPVGEYTLVVTGYPPAAATVRLDGPDHTAHDVHLSHPEDDGGYGDGGAAPARLGPPLEPGAQAAEPVGFPV